MNIQIDAVILAAGSSSRMGRPKQLLPLSGMFLLEHVIHQVADFPFARIFTVIGHRADLIQEKIHIADDRFQWLINRDYQAGQGTSLALGLRQVTSTHPAAMVFLADTPFLREETVRTIIECGQEQLQQAPDPFMVQPYFGDTPGHPVFFGHLENGLESVGPGDRIGQRLGEQIRRVPVQVDDPGICFDIDTPEAYERAVKIAALNNEKHANLHGGEETDESVADAIRIRRG